MLKNTSSKFFWKIYTILPNASIVFYYHYYSEYYTGILIYELLLTLCHKQHLGLFYNLGVDLPKIFCNWQFDRVHQCKVSILLLLCHPHIDRLILQSITTVFWKIRGYQLKILTQKEKNSFQEIKLFYLQQQLQEI